MGLAGHQKFIKLRCCHGRARQHCVHLAAVVRLVHEQVLQHVGGGIGLHTALATRHLHKAADGGVIGFGQPAQQPFV